MSDSKPTMANLRKGMRVSLTFEGTLASVDNCSVSFVPESGTHPTVPLSWSSRMTPAIEILDAGLQDGDVGVWTGRVTDTKVNVVFRRFNQNGSEGWYRIGSGEYVAPSNSDCVTLVLRADGTPVTPPQPVVPPAPKAPAPETPKAAYHPQSGDVALYRNTVGEMVPAFFMEGNPGFLLTGWYSQSGDRTFLDTTKSDFKLILRDGKLVEGS